MIRCNLAILLAERDLKITKVAVDTGISRTTLTSLSSNNCQGIQLDTLNNLCVYLNVNPNDIFPTLPFSIKCKEIILNETNDTHISYILVFLEASSNQKNLPIYIFCTMFQNYKNNNLSTKKMQQLSIADIEIETSFIQNENMNFNIKENNNLKYLKMMPIYFLNDLKETIINEISKQLHLEEHNIDFSFPDELVTMKKEIY